MPRIDPLERLVPWIDAHGAALALQRSVQERTRRAALARAAALAAAAAARLLRRAG